MPGFEEVKFYLQGLWLMILGNPAGVTRLDTSPRGSLRSFWAILWCLPPILLSWISTRMAFIAAMPPGTEAGGLFFFRLALSEFFGWIVPVLLAGVLLAIAGFGDRFNGVVAATNWLSIPFAYANGFLILLILLVPGLPGLIAFLWLILVSMFLISLERIYRMLCGGNTPLIVALVLMQIVPVLFLSDWINGFLGVAVP
ncbi:hypothetical protein [Gellertiella hungarica]|uniref:Yip1 domain-containing protein n=1 Tax=Gellertiella hungarica TaxID=1572859 RepID=A0A7W6J4S2_9HYPH|nr:hypothetical protein [Gellertiella hungarica]MBB4063828.1 hypothetical protein [Gellertiella hungarica]